MIGDTDFFIDLMRRRGARHEAAVAKAEALEAQGVRLGLTALTRFELAAGAELFVEPAAERERVQNLLRRYPSYDLDGAAADLAGSTYGRLRRDGEAIGLVDVLIAGIALANQEEVLTGNPREFARVDGLRTDSY